jgi:SAM-dependent methyltransferase
MSAQQHRSDPNILGRRTLEHDHRVLATCLRPGMSVLDAGCGTGAITAGIADAVGSGGRVLGIDRDNQLIEIARTQHGNKSNLQFEAIDVTVLGLSREFDISTAARTLQWISEPARAVHTLASATRSGGMVLVLDYNHSQNTWEPEPPKSFLEFYQAFLNWREQHGWDNEIGDRLPATFRSVGLMQVESVKQDEVSEVGLPEFRSGARLWAEVIDNVRDQLIASGLSTRSYLDRARDEYVEWTASSLQRQVLSLRAVKGTV